MKEKIKHSLEYEWTDIAKNLFLNVGIDIQTVICKLIFLPCKIAYSLIKQNRCNFIVENDNINKKKKETFQVLFGQLNPFLANLMLI